MGFATREIIKQRVLALSVMSIAAILVAGCGGGDSASGIATSAAKSATAAGVSASAYLALISGSTNSTSTSTAVVLPLEVMGSNGATTTVQVTAANGSQATNLWMQVNNLAYDNEGSVQINNGPWVALNNAVVKVQGAGADYGGIGGGFDTLKLTVPVTGAVNGSNTIRFRFNTTDGNSSGFRILNFNLQGSDGTNYVDTSTFKQDDPTAWVAPENDATDIAAGKALYQTATLTASPLSSSKIQAHCMDCHTANGSDLQRFNYSNYSIVTRAIFHGLSEAQGIQIASYIRSLTASLGVPGSHCRPWNPPYQPGPGLDSGDVKNWTCGAGLEAVSDSDVDTLKTLFPNNVNAQAMNFGSVLNAREIPISLQLPDWNHWIPRVHPKDAWGSYFTNSTLNTRYNGNGTNAGTYNLRANLTSGGTAYAQGQTGNLDNDLYYWGTALGEDFAPSGWGTSGNQSLTQQVNDYSTYQWQLVKSWELAQDFNLETNCPVNWKSIGAPKAETRGWCGMWRFAFDVSPHAMTLPVANTMFGSTVGYWTKSNQWYYLQLLLNPGNGAHNVHLPLDWQYAIGVFSDLQDASGRTEPARNLVYMVKAAQEMDNGVGVADVGKGWNTRDTSPMDVWKGGQTGIWKGVPLQTERDIVTAFLSNWVDVSNGFNINSWQRLGVNPAAGETDWCGWSIRSLCWWTYVPNRLAGSSPTIANFPSDAFNQIPQMRAEGINNTQLNRFASWLNTAYPYGYFSGLIK
jgi:hypothetical protein